MINDLFTPETAEFLTGLTFALGGRLARKTGEKIPTPLSSGGCRFCGATLEHVFMDLGLSPLANSYLRQDQIGKSEPFYPLKAFVCDQCFLVQLEVFERPDNIFSDYAYFSSYSDSWLRHCERYVEDVTQRFDLGPQNQVVEIASNDGYLLQYFVPKGIPVLGVEPAANVAEVAQQKGIPTRIAFFGEQTADKLVDEGVRASLIIGNNVLAHVPDINDMICGIKRLLAPGGVLTMEFPHLLRLMEDVQFDTIYHEHFSYISFTTAETMFAQHGITLFDVEELPTHGGSLRIYGRHTEEEEISPRHSPRVGVLKAREQAAGLTRIDGYASFSYTVSRVRQDLLRFLNRARQEGKTVVGYGAPAKGNTLLNYCDVSRELMEYTVDRNPYKQGRYLPGTHLPIYSPERIQETKPDYLLVLPWNLKDEIMEQMASIRSWGGKFVVPCPRLMVYA